MNSNHLYAVAISKGMGEAKNTIIKYRTKKEASIALFEANDSEEGAE